jgi:tetratricopeptide (TPR) repeat protein
MAGAPWSEDDLDGAERDFTHSLEVATNAAFGVGRVAALEGLAIVRWYRGHRTQAKELLDQSLAILETVADSPELVPPMLELGEFVVPEPRTGTSRLVFQETFIPFLELPGRTAAGYLLATRATMDRMEGDDARARLGLKAALELFRSIGDERAIAYALSRLGNLATATGEFARARELLEECLAIRGRIRDSRGIGLAQGNLGNLAIAEGDMTQARALLDDSADGFRRRGDMWGLGSALGNLASLALATGEIEEARQLLESSLAAVRITGRLRWTAWVLVQLAAVSRLAGDAESAATLSAEALEIFVRLADHLGEVEARALGARPGKTGAVSEYEPEPSGGA